MLAKIGVELENAVGIFGRLWGLRDPSIGCRSTTMFLLASSFGHLECDNGGV